MTEKTKAQIMRMVQKIAHKFPSEEEATIMTDIHIRINQETGDVMVYDDDDNELTRIVVDDWIENKDDDDIFYINVAQTIRKVLSQETEKGTELGRSLNIIMPYYYVLENETGEHIDEIYIADDDETMIIGTPIMESLDKDLEDFIRNLLEE